MNYGVWQGNSLLSFPRVLILGESHYDEENYGEAVSFPTSDVVKHYFVQREKWSQFFDKMAASFGYSQENAPLFYEKVFFGNYVDVVCGVGDSNAKKFIEQNRLRYNDDLFNFVNVNAIDIIVCFSKLVYNNLPSLNNMAEEEENIQCCVGKIGAKGNYVEFCTYMPQIQHPNCQVSLNKALRVYGIRHPSSQGGFNAEQIYNFMLSQAFICNLCADKINSQVSHKDVTSDLVDVGDLSQSNNIKVANYSDSYKQPNIASYEESKKSYPITPEVDSQFVLRIIAPMVTTLGMFFYGLFSGVVFVSVFAIVPLLMTIAGGKASTRRCPNCKAWNSWMITNQKLVKEDKVRVRRPLGSMYFRSSGHTTYGIRQTFVSADEKIFENTLKCRICGFETKSYNTNIDDKIR